MLQFDLQNDKIDKIILRLQVKLEVSTVSDLTKIKPSELPSDKEEIQFEEDSDTFKITMSQSAATKNMQHNFAAFEAWSLVAKSAGYARNSTEPINDVLFTFNKTLIENLQMPFSSTDKSEDVLKLVLQDKYRKICDVITGYAIDEYTKSTINLTTYQHCNKTESIQDIRCKYDEYRKTQHYAIELLKRLIRAK